MKTILKITAGILLAGAVMIGGCAALIGAGANQAVKESEKASASAAQVDQIKHGMSVERVHKIMLPAKPQLGSDSDMEGVGTSRIESFDVKDGGQVFGKSVTITYLDGKVSDITKTDLG
jgi:hypothetical protein